MWRVKLQYWRVLMTQILVEINSVSYEGFSSINVTRSIEAISGSFSLNATISQGNSFPIKVGDKCRIVIDGTSVINGFVENISVSYSQDKHNINIQGRDRTADLIDSSVIDELTYEGSISLRRIIGQTLRNLSITDISVSDEIGNLEDFDDTEREAADIGENAFDFIERYARKRQALLTTDGEGNILITRSSNNPISTNLLNEIEGSNNIIKNASVNYNYTERFNRYTISSQGNASIDIGAEISPDVLTDQQGESIDEEIRIGRQIVINAETSMSDATAADRALWERNIRSGRSRIYNVTVYGFMAEEDGLLWKPNFLVKIKDDFADIDAQMLIRSVTYSQSNDAGSTTTLEFVEKDTYTIQAKIDKATAESNNIGDEFL